MSSRPAIVNVSWSVTATSSSLDRAQDLDPRALAKLVRAPLAARDHLGVDGDRDAAAGGGARGVASADSTVAPRSARSARR